MAARHGLNVARVALIEAAPRGIPINVLVDLVAHVGGVSRSSAYQALRARIAPTTQYRAESGARWAERVIVQGHRLDQQVWIMQPIEQAEAG
jgi:hypothetical protein